MPVFPMSVRPLIVRQGTTVSTTFVPTDIGDLVAWYDASRITGLSDGATVTTWSDSSGNGNDVTQGTAGLRPIYKVNIINGLPVVRFDGTDDALATASALASLNDATVFTVYKHADGVPTANDEVFDRSTGTTHQLYLRGASAAHAIFTGAELISSVGLDANAHVFGATFSTTANDTWYVDATSASGNAGSNAGAGTLRLGIAALDGDIAEVVYYSRVLTAAEITQLRAYLGSKYNITVS